MTTKNNPTLKTPENFDLKKAKATINRIIQENKAWIKEMADK